MEISSLIGVAVIAAMVVLVLIGLCGFAGVCTPLDRFMESSSDRRSRLIDERRQREANEVYKGFAKFNAEREREYQREEAEGRRRRAESEARFNQLRAEAEERRKAAGR